ncbi:hypothetical protein OOK27_12170 [Streptomyces canus]|nr:hypothetical protein [Streptomyces canus]MCX5254917.1 hypothetical protein [Streptomyces canus]
MPIAHPVPFLGPGEEDIGATVVGVVDALHAGVGDEDARHLVVGDALHTITLIRMRLGTVTKTYVARRITEGKIGSSSNSLTGYGSLGRKRHPVVNTRGLCSWSPGGVARALRDA